MSEIQDILQDRERSNWVRLRTLVMLRWLAVAGQSLAILVAVRIYDLVIPLEAAALTILAAVAANVLSSLLYPEAKRLSEREASFMLSFDLVQLSVLLFLTGGLSNPFALLMLAPVTIAATVLYLRTTIVISVLAIALITLLSQFSIPIATAEGGLLVLPALFKYGFWVALVTGVSFLALYVRQVTTEMHVMGEALLATQLALAREQKLTDLGGVVAAAAHELGTPLATIKLVSSELMEELSATPDHQADAALIREQAERCRDILRSMGRAGKDDLHLHLAPLEAVVREAAEPHLERGKAVTFGVHDDAGDPSGQPTIIRRPEIIHGLRNLIQNAVDFADSAVEISVLWTEDDVAVRINDDGLGFPQSVLGRIGDPFVRPRRAPGDGQVRPEYEGMGLGLFIAKTLLERSGAVLEFSNGRRHGHAGWAGRPTGGAIVDVRWPRRLIDRSDRAALALGQNQPIAG